MQLPSLIPDNNYLEISGIGNRLKGHRKNVNHHRRQEMRTQEKIPTQRQPVSHLNRNYTQSKVHVI